MYIEFDLENVAKTLCEMTFLEEHQKEVEKALYHLKTIAENPYNDDYFRTLLEVLNTITKYDYMED